MAFPFRTIVILIFVIFYECNADSLPSETEPREIQQTTNILTNSLNGRPELPTLSILTEEDGQVIKEPVREENTISSKKVNIQGLESNKDVDQITSLKEEPIFKRKDSLTNYTNNESKVNNATTDIHLDKEVADETTTDVRKAVTTGISGEVIKENAVKNPEGNPALEAKENAAIDKDEATSNAKLTTDTSNIKQNSASLKDSATPIGRGNSALEQRESRTYQSTPKYTRKPYRPQAHNYRRRRPNRPRSQNDVEPTTILNPDEEVTTEPITTLRTKRPLRYDSTNHYYTSGAQTHHRAPAHTYHRRQYHPKASYLHKSKESNTDDENNEETTKRLITDEEVTTEPISTLRPKRPLRYDSTNHYYTSGAQTHHRAPAHTYRRRQYHPNASYLHKSKESNTDDGNNEETTKRLITDEEVTTEPTSTLRTKRPLRYDSTNHYYTSGAQTHHRAPVHNYHRRQYHSNASYLHKSKESNTDDENNEETTKRLITDEEVTTEPTSTLRTKRPLRYDSTNHYYTSGAQTHHKAPAHTYHRRQYHPNASYLHKSKESNTDENNEETTKRLNTNDENNNEPTPSTKRPTSASQTKHRAPVHNYYRRRQYHPKDSRYSQDSNIQKSEDSNAGNNDEATTKLSPDEELNTESPVTLNTNKPIRFRPKVNSQNSNQHRYQKRYHSSFSRSHPVPTRKLNAADNSSTVNTNDEIAQNQEGTTASTEQSNSQKQTHYRPTFNNRYSNNNKMVHQYRRPSPVLTPHTKQSENTLISSNTQDGTTTETPTTSYHRYTFTRHPLNLKNKFVLSTLPTPTIAPNDQAKKDDGKDDTDVQRPIGRYGRFRQYQREVFNRKTEIPKDNSEKETNVKSNLNQTESSNDVSGSGNDVSTTTSETTTSIYQRFRKNRTNMHMKPKSEVQLRHLENHENVEDSNGLDVPTTTSVYQRFRKKSPYMHIKPKLNSQVEHLDKHDNSGLKSASNSSQDNNEQDSTVDIPTTTSIYQRLRNNRPRMHIKPKMENRNDAGTVEERTSSIYQRFRTTRPRMHIKPVNHLENNDHSKGNNEDESTNEVPTTTSVYQRYRKLPPHMHLTPKPESQLKDLENHDEELKGNINEDGTVTVPTTTSIYQRFRTNRPRMHIKPVNHLVNNDHSKGNDEDESTDEVPTTTSVYQRYRKLPPHMHLTPKSESQVKDLENHDEELKGNINEEDAVTVPTTTSIYQRFRTNRPRMHIKPVNHLENNDHSKGNNEDETTDELPTTTSVYQRYRKLPPHMHLTPKSESQGKGLENHDEELNDHFKSNINEDDAVTVPTTSIYQRFRKNRPIIHLKPNLNRKQSSVQNEAKTDNVNDVNTTSDTYRKRIHIRPNHSNHNEEANDFNEDNEDSEDTMKDKTVSGLQNKKTHDNIDEISEEDVDNYEPVASKQIHTRNSFGNRRPNIRRRFNSRSYIGDEDPSMVSEDDDAESEIMETSQSGRSINHYGRPFRSPTNLENLDLERRNLGVNDPEESTHFLKRRSRENSSYKTDLNESETAKRETNGDKIPSDQNESHNLFSLVGDNDESLFETDDLEAGRFLFDIGAGINFNVKPASKLILNLPKSFILEENTSETNSSKLNNTKGESESEVENTEAIGLANQDEIAHMQEYIDERSGLLLNESEFVTVDPNTGEQNKENIEKENITLKNIENTNAEVKIEHVTVDPNQWFTVYKDEDEDKTKTTDEESGTLIIPEVSEAIEGRENITKTESTTNGTKEISQIPDNEVNQTTNGTTTPIIDLTTNNSEQTAKAEETKIEDKDESNDEEINQIPDKAVDQTTYGTTSKTDSTVNNFEQTPKAEKSKIKEISQIPVKAVDQTTNGTTTPIIDLTTNNSEQTAKAEETKIEDKDESNDEEINQIPDKAVDQTTDGTTSKTDSTANNSEQTPNAEDSKIEDKDESNDEEISQIPDKAVDQTTYGTTSKTDSTVNNFEQTPKAEKSKIKEISQIPVKAVDQTTDGTTTSIIDLTTNNSEKTPKAEESKIEDKGESNEKEISQIPDKEVDQTTEGTTTSITDSTANNSEQTPNAEDSKIEDKDESNDEEINQIPDKAVDQTTDGTISKTDSTAKNSEQTPNAEKSKIKEIGQIPDKAVDQTTDGTTTSITDLTANNSEQTPNAEKSKIKEISQIPDKAVDQTNDGTTTSITDLTANNSEQTPKAEDSKIEDDESNDEEISQIPDKAVDQITDGTTTAITDLTANNSEQTPKAEDSKIEDSDESSDEEISQIPDKAVDQITDGTRTSITDSTANNSEQTPKAEESKIKEISQIPDKEVAQTINGTTTSITHSTANNSEQTPNAEKSKIKEISQIPDKAVDQITDGTTTSMTDSTAHNSEQTPKAADSKIEDRDESSDEEISQIPDKAVDRTTDGTTSITDSTANNPEQTPNAAESKIKDKDKINDEEISQIPDKEVDQSTDATTTPITTNNLEQTSKADEESVSKEDDSTVTNNNVEKDKDSTKTNTSDSENDSLDTEPTEKVSTTKKYESHIFKVSPKTTPKSNIEISENEITDAHRNILGHILGKKTKLNVEVKIKDDIMYIPSNVTITEDLQNHNLNFSWTSKEETKYIMSLNFTRNEPKYYEIDSIKLYFVKDGIASVWMKNVTIHPKKDETADRGLTIEIEKDVKVMFSNVEFLQIYEDDQNIENINSAASESSSPVKMVHVEIAVGVLVVVSFFLVLLYIVIRKLRIMSIKKNNKVPTS